MINYANIDPNWCIDYPEFLDIEGTDTLDLVAGYIYNGSTFDGMLILAKDINNINFKLV